SDHTLAHAGQPASYALYVNNSGSTNTTLTLSAQLEPGAPNAAAWQVTPASQTFPIAAFKNETLLVTVTPPVGASPGARAIVNVTLSYPPNPDDPRTIVTRHPIELATEVA